MLVMFGPMMVQMTPLKEGSSSPGPLAWALSRLSHADTETATGSAEPGSIQGSIREFCEDWLTDE